MKRSRLFVLAGVVLVCGALVLREAVAQRKAAAVPTAVAVCDLSYLLNNLDKAKDVRVALERKAAEIQAQDMKFKKAADDLRLELDALAEGSADYEERFAEWQKRNAEWHTWRRFQEELGKRETHRTYKDLYEFAFKGIREVAEARGIDIVLSLEPQDIRSTSTEQLQDEVFLRKTLYAAKETNITEAVLAHLNEVHRTRKPN